MKTKKKGLRRKLVFFPRNQVKIKKKKGLRGNLRLYLARIYRIYSCWLALFCLIIQRSNLDGWASKPRWGDASPYNLSTDQWYTHSTNHPQCTVQSIVTERKIEYRQMPPEEKLRIRSVSCTFSRAYERGVQGVHRTRAEGGPDSWARKSSGVRVKSWCRTQWRIYGTKFQ